jgi:hypothetical protein
MKFCKNLQHVVVLSDPEWAPYWTNYKMLKVGRFSCKWFQRLLSWLFFSLVDLLLLLTFVEIDQANFAAVLCCHVIVVDASTETTE